MLRLLDLFSGIGGFSLGMEATKRIKTVGFCEHDKFCQKVLRKHWNDVPIYEDIKKLDGTKIKADVVTAGFPCPAFSAAGKKGGFEQDNLFFDVIRICKTIKPKFIIFENVENFKKWRDVLHKEVKNIGYEFEDAILDARDFGLPQARRRYFAICFQRGMLFSPQHLQRFQRKQGKNFQRLFTNFKDSKRWWTPTINSKEEWRIIFSKSFRSRKNNGISFRMDKFRSLGNAVCPQIPYYIGQVIGKLYE